VRILAGIAALLFATSAVAEYAYAPIVVPVEDRLEQTGWFKYETLEDGTILYCVPQSETLLTCAVYIHNKGIAYFSDIKVSTLGS
jgi:hypothetical protein